MCSFYTILCHKKIEMKTKSLYRLEWVYGYRGRDARCNLSILPTGEIIYYVAAVVVLNNLQEQSQRHYLGEHNSVYNNLLEQSQRHYLGEIIYIIYF